MPQTRIAWSNEMGTCAVGAGLHAMYRGHVFIKMGVVSILESEMLRVFPYMAAKSKCPSGRRWWWPWGTCVDRGETSLVKRCQHLNDFHEWTREQIADWLYTEEEKLGFVTVIETQHYCDTRDNNVNQHSPASETEKAFYG